MNTETKAMSTPWGKAQTVYPIIDGIVSVSTAGHGGIKLDRSLNARVPEYMREAGGWYEEDCDWAIPFVVFEAQIILQGDDHARKVIKSQEHIKTLRSWKPDAYEKYFQCDLKEGESYIRDEQLFAKRNAANYVVTSAFGDWHANVPAGFAGVVATLGGRRGIAQERYFLIPSDEYAKRDHFGFVVDLERHKEIARFF